MDKAPFARPRDGREGPLNSRTFIWEEIITQLGILVVERLQPKKEQFWSGQCNHISDAKISRSGMTYVLNKYIGEHFLDFWHKSLVVSENNHLLTLDE